MKNSISKKALSAFLAIMMIFATMAGMFTFSASADAISDNWTDDTYYDLSWITPYDGTPASTANYVQVGDKYYQVLGYDAGTEFTIENAADLAGLAKLTGSGTTATRTQPYFSNCTFKITAEEIDLSKHYWIPIGYTYQTQIFGGHLIGANSKDANGIVTINGMTINETQAKGDKSFGVGLVGNQGGGSIENITLTNAKITSNTNFACGSFVGYQWGPTTANSADEFYKPKYAERCTTTYKNLTSDAVINRTSGATNTTDRNAVGGIAGAVACGNYITLATFDNCTFNGSITTTAYHTGGIFGYGENGGNKNCGTQVYLTDCCVSAPIEVSEAKSVGGLIGYTKAMVVAKNCAVSSEISSTVSSAKAGGLVGSQSGINLAYASDTVAPGKGYMSFNGCSFSGSISEAVTVKGLYVAEGDSNTTNLVLTNCTVSGNTANSQSINWFGSKVSLTESAFTGNSSSVLTKYYDGATSVPAIKDANETTIKDLGIQMSNNDTRMRVSAQILGKEYDKAGFEFYVTYTVDGVVKSSKINAMDVSTCYTSIKAGDETIYADKGYYYIVFVIDGFDSATMSDISIGFAASVTKDATVTWSDSAYCDATVEVTQPG